MDDAMNLSRNRALLVLGVYLILIGVIQLFGINLGHLSLIVPVLAIVAGILLIVGK
jgi:hypothetical protein